MKRSPLKRKARKKQLGDDPCYLAWIRTLPCLICAVKIEKLVGLGWDRKQAGQFQYSPTEPHHAGDHGYAQRPPDRMAIPLCAEHHRTGKDAAHGPLGKNFWAHHGLDRNQIIRELNQQYDQLEKLREW